MKLSERYDVPMATVPGMERLRRTCNLRDPGSDGNHDDRTFWDRWREGEGCGGGSGAGVSGEESEGGEGEGEREAGRGGTGGKKRRKTLSDDGSRERTSCDLKPLNPPSPHATPPQQPVPSPSPSSRHKTKPRMGF